MPVQCRDPGCYLALLQRSCSRKRARHGCDLQLRNSKPFRSTRRSLWSSDDVHWDTALADTLTSCQLSRVTFFPVAKQTSCRSNHVQPGTCSNPTFTRRLPSLCLLLLGNFRQHTAWPERQLSSRVYACLPEHGLMEVCAVLELSCLFDSI